MVLGAELVDAGVGVGLELEGLVEGPDWDGLPVDVVAVVLDSVLVEAGRVWLSWLFNWLFGCCCWLCCSVFDGVGT